MDLEQTVAALLSENQQLRQENDQLKSMLTVVKENIDLKARMHSFNSDTLEEITGICSVFFSASRWQSGCRSELSEAVAKNCNIIN